MIQLRKLEVLLVEDNAIRDRLAERYVEFFQDAGYQAAISIIRCDAGTVQSSVAKYDPHVVVTDLSFGNLKSLEGLKLAKWIKKAHPNIFVIVNSGENPAISNFVGVDLDLFVPKGKFLTKDKRHWAIALTNFSSSFRRNTEIVFEGEELENNFKAQYAREIRRLISECLFTTHEYDPEFDPVVVKPKSLTRGFSDSRVFSLRPRSKGGNFDHIKAVVKISQIENARQELLSYNRYVKWTLPYDWRVDVLGSSFGAKFGAVCYSFITGEEDEFHDLEHFIESANFARVKSVIDRIMDVDSRKWYRGDIYSNLSSISEYYSDRYFVEYGSDVQESQDIFESDIQTVLDFVSVSGRISSKKLGVSIELPVLGVYSKFDSECQTCIGHGDLHARNIILSDKDDGKIVFIDFQQTGRCHVFEDFVVFQTSIRLNYPNEGISDEEIFELECRLHRGEDMTGSSKFELMASIRDRAYSHFEDENRQNFVFASLSFNLRLLREVKITGIARKNIVLNVAAAAHVLAEHINGT